MEIKIKEKSTIYSSDKVAEIMIKILKAESKSDRQKEHFWGIYLNARNVIIKIELISLGILDSCITHPRETFNPAITCGAASLIVVHNHPSGETAPSEKDKEVTEKLVKAGEILGIPLLEHLIIIENGDYSSMKSLI